MLPRLTLKEMYASGCSLSAIAKRFGVNATTVFRQFKKYGLKTDAKRRYDGDGNRIVRGRYVWVKMKRHPNANYAGYVREHILVMEHKIKRRLRPGEVVHHKDFNPLNNRPGNLQLLTDSAHKRLHALRRKRNKGLFKKGR